MARITVQLKQEEYFYKLRKELIKSPHYIDMSNESIIAYTLLEDLLDFSIGNKWFNEKGELYVKMKRENLMPLIRVKSKKTYAKVMKELIKYELIEIERNGRVPYIYVNTVKVRTVDIGLGF